MEIDRIALPDALFTREVNAIVIKDDPVTLIDGGPNTKQAFEALARGLQRAGIAIEDIRRIVITHSHLDHCGLAQEVRRRSGAEVLARAEIRPWIQEYSAEWNKELIKIMALLETYNVPRSYITAVVMTVRRYKKLGSASSVNIPLEPGSEIEFADFKLEVMSNPGHTNWCISLFEPTERILFCGDLFIENLTSHPLMQPTPQETGDWPNQVEMIHESLDAVCALKPRVIFPGHGDPIQSAEAVRNKIHEGHAAKQDRIVELLDGREESLFQINQKLCKYKTPVEIFIEIFETLHHLRCLIKKGVVKQKESAFSLQ